MIRFTAAGFDVREFARSHWNVFDFVVIAVSFLPGLRSTAMLLRPVRLARIVRIIRFLPDLPTVIGAIATSIPGVASLAHGEALLIYSYGMPGWVLFIDHDPDHYGNFGRAVLTMYIMLTLENLPDNVEMGLRLHRGPRGRRAGSAALTPRQSGASYRPSGRPRVVGR